MESVYKIKSTGPTQEPRATLWLSFVGEEDRREYLHEKLLESTRTY